MKESRRNYFIGLNNGMLTSVSQSILNPNFVLAAFLYSVTGSAFLVGLLATVHFEGMFLPQLYMSSLIEHQKRKKPFFIYALALRIGMLIIMILLIFLSSRIGSIWILYIYIFVFFFYKLFRGAEFIVFWDFFGGAVAPNKLGEFIAYRTLLSNIAAMVTGILLIQPIISIYGDSHTSVLILSLVTFGILLLDLLQLSLVREVPNESPPAKRSLRKTAAGGVAAMKESPNYRKLLVLRILHRINMLNFTFLIPFAVEHLGIIGIAGIFLTILQVTKFSTSVLWGRVSRRFGNRTVLLSCNILFTLGALLVLVSSGVPDIFHMTLRWLPSELNLPMLIIILAIVTTGAGLTGNTISFKAFVLESAPKHRRSSSLAFINTAAAPIALLAPICGFIVEQNPMYFYFFYVFIAGIGVVSAAVAASLKEVRHEVPREAATTGSSG